MMFACCDERRLEVLRRAGSKNAIEFVEVLDHDAPPGVPPQRTLFVRLLLPPAGLTSANVRIAGGERIPTVPVDWAAPGDNLPAAAETGLVDGVEELPRTLVIRTGSAGDFSRYTLSLLASSSNDAPPSGFDPLLASIEFSFKVECPSSFDCAAPLSCPVEPAPAPRIDYLAKDYAGFRRQMLDRLSLLVPGWTERSPADVGVTLVELLAFAADTLSYRQDVIANEAYLNTARQRISVRRHARLVDYYLHEGCNARAFVHFEVGESGDAVQQLPAGTTLLTRVPKLPAVIEPDSSDERDALAAAPLVFETADAAELYESLNRLSFYTWGNTGCCLPRGATRATLKGRFEHLAAGAFLILIEERSPTKGSNEDADPRHRHVVRLTVVRPDVDPSGQLFEPSGIDGPVDITHIEWDSSDALPFPLCISVADAPGVEISAALGNVVIVEHGETRFETLAEVPESREQYAAAGHTVGECCAPPQPKSLPLRFRPALAAAPLAHGFELAQLLARAAATPAEWWSAAAFRALSAREALPQVFLTVAAKTPPETWDVQRDLLGSDADATDFVAEIDDRGRALLRFGDDADGRRPDEHTIFNATYRVGNGSVGNVGADAIAHVVIAPAPALVALGNPLPAFGGSDAEDVDAARRDAPQAFRTQQRAVTAADYAAAAEQPDDVQRAAASFRWTGSWHTVFVTADRIGGAAVDSDFEAGLRRHLERFRMAGYDLEVDAPRFVALEVALHVCVKPTHFRADVLQAVREALSSRLLPDGRPGIFHPNNFTFAQPVYSSRIVAAAQAVDGVDSVRLDKFQRLAGADPSTLANGVLPIGRLEIARLDNDPNYPDRGRLTLTAGGGK